MRYLLDANVFIQAYRFYYPFDIFPKFWEWLETENTNGRVFSLDMVFDEIKEGKDKLAEWCKNLSKVKWFLSSEDENTQHIMNAIADWIMSQNYKDAVKAEFLGVADPWLIAKAKSGEFTIVTQEKSEAASKRKIFIPDVCKAFGVPYLNTIELLRTLGAKF